ncbi:unnamed protein product [Symbiodinium microadriaticum]|nr:unnamed protein product [Symbiodinium microadriaticum]
MPEVLVNALKLHQQALCREGDEHRVHEPLYIKVQNRRVDFEVIKEPPTYPPDWLPELLRRMDRLTFWEPLGNQNTYRSRLPTPSSWRRSSMNRARPKGGVRP